MREMYIPRLNRARGNRDEIHLWINRIRRQQNDAREKTKIAELYHFDVLRGLYIVKLNPMAAWAREQVQDSIKKHALTAFGYRFIGHTRSTANGENERAARWTGFDKRECAASIPFSTRWAWFKSETLPQILGIQKRASSFCGLTAGNVNPKKKSLCKLPF